MYLPYAQSLLVCHWHSSHHSSNFTSYKHQTTSNFSCYNHTCEFVSILIAEKLQARSKTQL